MKVVWDERKCRSNLAKHGLDFADLPLEFFETSVVVPAAEGRYMAINALGRDIVAVVFARLGTEGISIVSMRPASRRERRLL